MIMAEARKCRYCGEMLQQVPAHNQLPAAAPPALLSEDAVRRGVSQAHEDHRFRNVLGVEMLVLAGLIGFAQHSWWVFGGVFLVLAVCLRYRALAVAMCVCFSLFWGTIAYFIVLGLFSSIAAGVVISIFAFLASYAVHSSSSRWMRNA